MIDFDFYNDCTGCGGCSNICPVNAIEMRNNQEGFLEPYLKKDKCIDCGLCEKICPHISKNEQMRVSDKAWIYISENECAKKKSSSGAAFYEIAKAGISEGCYVCGCAWNEDIEAIHIVGDDLKTIERLQGSKYVQSDVKNVYKEVIDLLQKDEKVIFSGTPCQCTAVTNCVKVSLDASKRNNLLTVAVICHGVASPAVWESYKNWIMEKENSQLIGVNFRDKSKEGYKKPYCRYDYVDGKSTYTPTFYPNSKYIEATLVYNLALRNSCSHCDAKGHNENIDIILGDWYQEYEGVAELGTSCIVAYTKRGEQYILDHLKGLVDIDYTNIYIKNKFIEESEIAGKNRDKFFTMIEKKDIWNNVEKLYPPKYPIKKLLISTGLYEFIKGKKK